MKMRFLGKSGIKVSEVCLGTMTFGSNSRMKQIGSVGQPEADKIVAMALDGGINFFDTADLYSEGQSEEILGKALENGVKISSWQPKSVTAWGRAERYRTFPTPHSGRLRGQPEAIWAQITSIFISSTAGPQPAAGRDNTGAGRPGAPG